MIFRINCQLKWHYKMSEEQPLLQGSKQQKSTNNYDQIESANENNEIITRSSEVNHLSKLDKILFGLGHIYNDLCAAMWFSYTLLFLQAVLELDSTTAGSMMLLGQIMDAMATPVVGILADRWSSKRIWHLFGTALVLFSFPMIFSRCLGCWISSAGTYLRWWQPFYYALVITIFQCGWAIVQISHLAMIPILAESPNERSELTAIRYTASVCSGVTVYVITWAILHIESSGNETAIGPIDDYKFRNISLLLTVIGCVLSIVFHFGLRHKINVRNNIELQSNEYISNIENSNNENLNGITIPFPKDIPKRLKKLTHKELIPKINFIKKNFFLSPSLYQVTLLYVASRLFSALGLVYMPLYLDERLTSSDSTETIEAIASVPLATYISSFFTSLLLKYRNKYFNNKLLYIVGSMISIGTCVWIALFLAPSSGAAQLYTVAALLGAGSSITMVTSLCITADLIGSHSDQSAVVYSMVTFADKLITGIAVVLIEYYKCTNKEDCPEYYRGILAYVCGGSALLGTITMLVSQIAKSTCINSL
ncbi:major facilitator superfamily domain-containing protein 12-like [Arctopsyche grandis]|uniref:major facilitator superfamily domain-containing protein 12-like n=1 Tax=Arctopsyche grandis TaxID=121162 RepID=UPI00406D664C